MSGDASKHIEAVRAQLRARAWSPDRVETALQELALRGRRSRHSGRGGRVRGGVLVAATGVAIAVVALVARHHPPASSPSLAQSPLPSAATAVTSTLAFGDGTEIIVDSGAELAVGERTPTRVSVTLKTGRARFHVRHDPSRHFHVVAGSVDVEDVGTSFEVEHTAARVRVAVSEGAVAIAYARPRTGDRESVALRAGQTGIYPDIDDEKEDVAPAQAVERPGAGDDTHQSAPIPPVWRRSTAHERAPATTEPRTWRALARAGHYDLAYALLARSRFRDVADDPVDLLLAADVARLSHHASASVPPLRALLATHERDPRAPAAAFTLGWVLMNDVGRPRDAAAAFTHAEQLAPHGNLAEDAAARAVEAWYQAGDLPRAHDEMTSYERRYPHGRHEAALRRLLAAQ